MNLFPFFMDISGCSVFIIGGGSVAKEKLDSLLRFGEHITVIAPDTSIEESELVSVIRRDYLENDILDADIVICATDDREKNADIARLCRDRGIYVNVADDPKLCTFMMPAIIKRGSLTVAVSTGGASPLYAGMLREDIEDELPAHIEEILDRMAKLRLIIPMRVPDRGKRRELYHVILRELLDADNEISDAMIEQRIREYEG